MYQALESHPYLLTLEDFVANYGEKWGFQPKTILGAKERVELFHKLVGHKRYHI